MLQQTGDLQLLSADLNQPAVIWHTNTAYEGQLIFTLLALTLFYCSTPPGLYAAFLFIMGDDRGINVYGAYSPPHQILQFLERLM